MMSSERVSLTDYLSLGSRPKNSFVPGDVIRNFSDVNVMLWETIVGCSGVGIVDTITTNEFMFVISISSPSHVYVCVRKRLGHVDVSRLTRAF